MLLLRKADGGERPPSRFGISCLRWEGKDRGVPAKMGMQGVRGLLHGGCALQGFRPAHHAVAARFRCDLLALGQTLKAMSPTAGLPRNVVKKIERARLSGLYTEGEGSKRKLRKPERQGRYLGADTFKLHGGHRCATVIVDLKMGHVLWLIHSKGGLAF